MILNYRKDGSTFWNELQISPIFNDEGKLIYFVGNQVDVSVEMELFENIMNAKHEWLITAGTINDLIILTDVDGKIIRCNKAVTTFFNSDFSKLIGSSVRELFASTTSDNKSSVEDLLYAPIAEFQFTNRKGYYEISNYPITVNDVLTKRVHLVRDITYQKEVKKQLEWLNKAIQQAFDSIVITSTDGTIEQVNKSFEQKTKWKNSEIVGLNLFEFYFEPSSKNTATEIQSKKFLDESKNQLQFSMESETEEFQNLELLNLEAEKSKAELKARLSNHNGKTKVPISLEELINKLQDLEGVLGAALFNCEEANLIFCDDKSSDTVKALTKIGATFLQKRKSWPINFS